MLKPVDKDLRSFLLENLAELGGTIGAFEEYRLTVLVCPVIKGTRAKFANVSISTCSENDTFSRKVGELQCLMKWDMGEFITVPFAGRNDEELIEDICQVSGILHFR